MPVESASFIDDLDTSLPTVNDPTSQGDDHLRLLKSVLQSTFPNATKAFYFPSNVSKTFADTPVTVATSDQNKLFRVSASGGAVTLNLPAAATAGAGFRVGFKKVDSSANAVTIDGNGTETIDGNLTWTLTFQFEFVWLESNGSNWLVIGTNDAGALGFTATGDIAATNVASALAELDTEKAQLSQTDQFSFVIEAPEDGDYKLIVDSKFGFTIEEITSKSDSGTCTATFKIGSTALGGSANSVSSSEQTRTHSSNNVLAAGDDFNLTVSSNSSCEKASFTVKITRTLSA